MPEHVKSTRPILLFTQIGVLAFCLIIALTAFRQNASGETEFTFFGQSFKSTHIGIGALFICGVIIVLIVKRIFKSLDHAVSSENLSGSNDSEHTRLLAEQVKAQREATDYQRQKDHRESQPCFVWRGGSQTIGKMVCNFQNTGGRIKITGWGCRPPGGGIKVIPEPWIDHNQQGAVVFERSEGLNAYYYFEIRFINSLGTPGEQRFYVELDNGTPEEQS
jgi:hypothetical protein